MPTGGAAPDPRSMTDRQERTVVQSGRPATGDMRVIRKSGHLRCTAQVWVLGAWREIGSYLWPNLARLAARRASARVLSDHEFGPAVLWSERVNREGS